MIKQSGELHWEPWQGSDVPICPLLRGEVHLASARFAGGNGVPLTPATIQISGLGQA